MSRIPLSPVAAALFRALLVRAGVPRDRILLSGAGLVDWQSLTFAGEQHRIELRILGDDSRAAVERMCAGLEEVEFDIAGAVVADIAVIDGPEEGPADSTAITIEALTVSAD